MDKDEKQFRSLRDQRARELEYFTKRYRSQMQALDKSPVAKTRSLTEHDYYALGKQLNQYECYQFDINEADGSTSSLGVLPKIALDTITANYGSSPLSAFAGVQPIEEQIGIIYFRNFVAQTARGNVQVGDKLISSRAVPDRFPTGFAGNQITGEQFINVAGGGTQSFSNVQLGGSASFMVPVDPRLVTIYGSAVCASGTATFTAMTPDPTTGAFSGAAAAGASIIGVTGTVNFQTGQVSLSLSANPTGQTSFFANYSPMPEGMTDNTKAILVMDAMNVQTQDYILKSTIGLFETYQMRKRLGMNAEEEIARDLTAIVNQEITNAAIKMLIANCPGGNSVTWTRQAQSGTSTFEHQMTLKNALTDASALLYTTAGRGNVNVLLAGLKACAVLQMLPGFKKLYDDMDFGAHIFGTLDGVTIIRVPYADVMDTNTIIGLHRGKNPYDCPVVWAPYMPMFVTNTLPMAYNAAQQQRAVACSGALAAPVPNLTTKVVIDQSGFNYA